MSLSEIEPVNVQRGDDNHENSSVFLSVFILYLKKKDSL